MWKRIILWLRRRAAKHSPGVPIHEHVEANEQQTARDQEVDQGTPFTPWPGILEGSDPRTHQAPGQPEADAGREQAQHANPELVRLQWDSNRIQRRIGFVGLLLLLATIISNGLLYYVSNKSAEAANTSAQVAQRELEITNRPWVRGTFKLTEGVSFDERGGMWIGWTGSLTNQGNSPATFIAVTGHPFAPVNQGDIFKEQTKACEWALRDSELSLEEMAHGVPATFGTTLFQDETTSWYPTKTNILGVDVARAEREGVNQRLYGVPGFLPMLAVCIAYRYGFDRERYDTTAYLFSIARIERNPPGLDVFHSGVAVPLEDVSFGPYLNSAILGLPYPTPTPTQTQTQEQARKNTRTSSRAATKTPRPPDS